MRMEQINAAPTKKFRLGLTGALFLFCLAFVGGARSEEGLVSTMEMMDGIAAIDGIRLVSPSDMSGTIYTEDYGPSQVLEIIRPDMRPVTIGRLSTSCSCITAIVPKRSFAQGERAFIEVRNVKPSQPGGATYAVWAQISSPYRAALQYELFVKSDRSPGEPVPAAVASPVEIVVAAPAPSPAPVSALKPAGGKEHLIRYEDIEPYTPKPVVEDAAEETEESEDGVIAEDGD